MNTYSKELTALDARRGRIHTVVDWEQAAEKKQRTPELLDEDDITILAGFGGEQRGTEARELRAKALEARYPELRPPLVDLSDHISGGMAPTNRDGVSKAHPSVTDGDVEKGEIDLSQVRVKFPNGLWDSTGGGDLLEVIEKWATKYALKATPIFLWWRMVATSREKSLALEVKINALTERLTALESRPGIKFTGVWKTGETYKPGDAVTYVGGLWICRAATPGEPSKDFVGWTLAVKSRTINVDHQ